MEFRALLGSGREGRERGNDTGNPRDVGNGVVFDMFN
jgi:hypothetical protein